MPMSRHSRPKNRHAWRLGHAVGDNSSRAAGTGVDAPVLRPGPRVVVWARPAELPAATVPVTESAAHRADDAERSDG